MSKEKKQLKNAYRKQVKRKMAVSDVLAIIAPSFFLFMVFLTIFDPVKIPLPIWIIIGGLVGLGLMLLSFAGYMFQIKSPAFLSGEEHSSLHQLEPSGVTHLMAEQGNGAEYYFYLMGGIRALGLYIPGGGRDGVAIVPKEGRIVLGGGISVHNIGIKFKYEDLMEEFKDELMHIRQFHIGDPIKVYMLPPNITRYLLKIHGSEFARNQLQNIITSFKMTNSYNAQLKNQTYGERAFRNTRSNKLAQGYDFQPTTNEEISKQYDDR